MQLVYKKLLTIFIGHEHKRKSPFVIHKTTTL